VHISSSVERRDMPSLSDLNIKLPSPNLKFSLGRRSGSGSAAVGLDIQPGFVGAVQASVNGSILATRVAGLPLPADTVREGEVIDEGALSEVLRELFSGTRLSKRVRVGVANQRTVMRTLELPPVTDRKELAAAVRFQAQDQVPMPLSNAVLDFHPLGIVETPAGPRQHVVLVAAQRDMVEHLLAAVRGAGLTPVGIDLAAFAMIRSLYRPQPQPESDPESESEPKPAVRVVYLNVDGLTNLAIAEGTTCRFTRVVGGGIEGMAGELAERLGIALTDTRALLAAVDLSDSASIQPSAAPEGIVPQDAASSQEMAPESTVPEQALPADLASEEHAPDEDLQQPREPLSSQDHDALEHAMSYSEMSAAPPPLAPEVAPESPATADAGSDARNVLESGIREISGEVRNSLDFHRSQEGGGEVSHVVLSGSVLDIPGFAEALQGHLGLEVRAETVRMAEDSSGGAVSMHRLSVAAGLATEAVQP
jgi:type IV pilus assembly protein PilM